MKNIDTAIEGYIAKLTDARQEPARKLCKTIRDNLPAGFKKVFTSSPAYVVPLERFPAGYHCTPNTPLSLMSVVSVKTCITLHHFGLYMNPALLRWFTSEYAQQSSTRLGMGKGCVRFKNMDQIPYKLIGELVAKITVEQYLDSYQKALGTRAKPASDKAKKSR